MWIVLPWSQIPSLRRAEVMSAPHGEAIFLAHFESKEGFFPQIRPEASIFAVWEAIVAVGRIGVGKISHPEPIFEHSRSWVFNEPEAGL